MRFNSVQFLVFFPAVVLGYFVIPQKLKNVWLLAASYYFYMSWHPVYALLILFSTVSTFFCAVLIEKSRTQRQKKLFLAVNIAMNLAILFYFKYFNFFVESVVSLFPAIHLSKNNNMIAVVGISFYTLQSLGYSIDVYRGSVEREKSFLNYALFVSFFPQLVAGPIERSKNLLPQLRQTYKFDYDRVTDGLVLMAWGFFKKLVIADGAAKMVDLVYNEIYSYSGLAIIIATVLFAFQIYCDFSGYSDIAIGAANVLGIKLMRNFFHPYFAKDIDDFWKRWHISLTDWLREYIYFPLGGSRKGTARKYINILAVFLISGLWHGAAWTFVIWGALHGIFRIINAVKMQIVKNSPTIKKLYGNSLYGVLKTVITFFIVDFTYIFFRANTLRDAFYAVSHLFDGIGNVFNAGYFTAALTEVGFFDVGGVRIAGCILFMLCVELWEGKSTVPDRINKCAVPIRWAFYYSVMLLILFFGNFGQSRFIYFQF
ncbi:MAG: MBOAT family protein [Oscillospiraceae bacterium]|nr:MBOAT family protein [Oscillospiraceae bacterium]